MKPVYTLANLVSRETLDAGAAKPARLAVLGWPVAHSASPQMHQAALDALGIDARYIRLEVEPGSIPAAFDALRALGFTGCNVTVPHKLDAFAACDRVDPAAQALGAVNTVRFDPDATCGFNTDAPGFTQAVEEAFAVPLRGQKVMIVGAGGGAGQAVAAACRLAGVAELFLANRTPGKLDELRQRLAAIGPGDARITTVALDDPSLAGHCRNCDLIVNTASVGLKPGDPPLLTAGCLHAGQRVYDTIYQPPVTPLLALAREAGCHTANGLSMLIHQGAFAFQLWFPGTTPLPWMREALSPKAG